MDLIEVELQYANLMVFGEGNAKSINQLKLEALQSKVKAVEMELAKTSEKLLSEAK